MKELQNVQQAIKNLEECKNNLVQTCKLLEEKSKDQAIQPTCFHTTRSPYHTEEKYSALESTGYIYNGEKYRINADIDNTSILLYQPNGKPVTQDMIEDAIKEIDELRLKGKPVNNDVKQAVHEYMIAQGPLIATGVDTMIDELKGIVNMNDMYIQSEQNQACTLNQNDEYKLTEKQIEIIEKFKNILGDTTYNIPLDDSLSSDQDVSKINLGKNIQSKIGKVMSSINDIIKSDDMIYAIYRRRLVNLYWEIHSALTDNKEPTVYITLDNSYSIMRLTLENAANICQTIINSIKNGSIKFVNFDKKCILYFGREAMRIQCKKEFISERIFTILSPLAVDSNKDSVYTMIDMLKDMIAEDIYGRVQYVNKSVLESVTLNESNIVLFASLMSCLIENKSLHKLIIGDKVLEFNKEPDIYIDSITPDGKSLGEYTKSRFMEMLRLHENMPDTIITLTPGNDTNVHYTYSTLPFMGHIDPSIIDFDIMIELMDKNLNVVGTIAAFSSSFFETKDSMVAFEVKSRNESK